MTIETKYATPMPIVTVETFEPRYQSAPLLHIFSRGHPQCKVVQFDTPGKRTRLITKQYPETLTEHAAAVEHAESEAIKNRGL